MLHIRTRSWPNGFFFGLCRGQGQARRAPWVLDRGLPCCSSVARCMSSLVPVRNYNYPDLRPPSCSLSGVGPRSLEPIPGSDFLSHCILFWSAWSSRRRPRGRSRKQRAKGSSEARRFPAAVPWQSSELESTSAQQSRWREVEGWPPALLLLRQGPTFWLDCAASLSLSLFLCHGWNRPLRPGRSSFCFVLLDPSPFSLPLLRFLLALFLASLLPSSFPPFCPRAVHSRAQRAILTKRTLNSRQVWFSGSQTRWSLCAISISTWVAL